MNSMSRVMSGATSAAACLLPAPPPPWALLPYEGVAADAASAGGVSTVA
jgi:hypothetical protein